MATKTATRLVLAGLLVAVLGVPALVAVMDERAQASGVVTEHCGFSHEGNDDPIVHPSEPGSSHLHEFAGNPSTNAFSTPDSLFAAAKTTCADQPADFSGYWVPAVYVDGVKVPVKLSPYWKSNGVKVTAAPFGTSLVAGHDWGHSAFFACTPGGFYPAPPDCTGKGVVKLRVLFQSCWDGIGTVQADFAYPAGKVCPVGFVHIPLLFLQIDTKIVNGTGHTWTLAFGADGTQDSYTTAHADFLDAWTPSAMDAIVTALNA